MHIYLALKPLNVLLCFDNADESAGLNRRVRDIGVCLLCPFWVLSSDKVAQMQRLLNSGRDQLFHATTAPNVCLTKGKLSYHVCFNGVHPAFVEMLPARGL